jgi:polysaccharide biosynthesis transport protein
VELDEYLMTLRKRWLVIVITAAVGALGAYLYAHMQPPQYKATAKLFVSLARGDTVGDLVQGSTYTSNLVQSFVQLTTMPVVLDPTIKQLELDTTSHNLARSVQADSPINTMIIEITAASSDPQQAADIANTVARNLRAAVADVSPTSTDGGASIKLNEVSRAEAPLFPFSPNTKLSTATGLAAGLALGVLLALLLSRLDTKVRSAGDVPPKPERVILGNIPVSKDITATGPQALVQNPHGPIAESYRRVRTSLEFLDVASPAHVLVVTSAIPGEGKSTTALHLAMTYAEKGRRVLLIDADMRRPSVARRMDVEENAGLSTLLLGDATMKDIIQHWSPRLELMTSGVIPPNPGQLIDSDRMLDFLTQIRKEYDLVVFDTPPLLAVTDAAVLARHSDGAVVVAGCNIVDKKELAAALKTLDTIDATCLGVVMNQVRDRDARTYSYQYYTAKSQPTRRWWQRNESGSPSA